MAFVYLFVAFIFLLYIKKTEKTFLVPSSLIVLTWGIFPFFYSLGPLGLYPLSNYTHFVILLSLFSFFIAYYLFHFGNGAFNRTQSPFIWCSNDINYKILIILNLMVAIWLYPKVIENWTQLIIVGMANQRRLGFESMGTLNSSIYDVFAKPVIIASTAIWSIDLFRPNGNVILRRFLFILIILNVVAETIIFAARATTVKIIYFLLFSYFFVHRHDITKKVKLKVLSIVGLISGALAFVTSLRNVGLDTGSSFWETIIVYYVPSFGLLDYYITHPSFSMLDTEHLTYGTCIFGFIYNAIQSVIILLFGGKYQGTDYMVTQITSANVPISPILETNAMCTADYCFLRDFGIFGVILGFSLCAAVIVKIRNNYYRFPNIRNSAFYVFFLYSTFRLSICYDFLFPSAFMTVIFILVGTRRT